MFGREREGNTDIGIRSGPAMISSSSSPPSSSSSSNKQASKWRSGTQHKIYGRRLLDALRATGGGQPRAVKAAADSALALTARGQTRWSRAILLAGAACSRRRVLVKAGGKIRRRHRHRRPNKSSKAASLSMKEEEEEEGRGKVQERLRVLGRLVPGCRKLPAPDLLEEAVDYVAALQMQVSTMRALADALAAAQLSDDAGAPER